MTDKDKVIKSIECCLRPDNTNLCGECSYKDISYNCKHALIKDVYKLLKEQEAVEPIPPTDESDLWRCGNCNHQLFRCTHQRYCEMCGRAVKWE